ncbi:MAG: thioredoxin domain-containing protein [Pseudomonadota bacterium]|nr:thioredoxin domain-containing protein [Pseudomonadota bacterium]
MPLPPENLLCNETSPYLLQHADNPVHWRPWGPEALAEARELNKPILLSIGYAACHWCHVMAHESFEDPATAEVMNQLFVNIKVDREERPEVDQIYMNALHALGEQGGWPLTMFLTPDGGPFWGGTYFPNMPRFGRPSFLQIMDAVARVFREEPDKVEQNRQALIAALNQAPAQEPQGRLSRQLLDTAAERLLTLIDPVNGGTRGAPKFPQAGLFELFWRAGKRLRDERYIQVVTLTLERIGRGGIYDHLGGGFARYSVDERWLVPHFEKMLYDNAQLLGLLGLAYAETGARFFAQKAEETVSWLTREMVTEGAFAASLDADSEGEEGKFYVWTRREVENVLGEDAAAFCDIYDVTQEGNWEHVNVLNRLSGPAWRGDAEEDRLKMLRDRLFMERERRVRPGRDDKLLADWNGLMIAALASAGLAFERPYWLTLAERAYAAITNAMAEGDRLAHAARAGRRVFPGLATDYADMIKAALALHEATGETRFLDDARRWAAALDAHHWNSERGGYYLPADDAEALIVRPWGAADEATPNANGVMAENLTRLWLLTGEETYRERADAIFQAFAGEVPRNVFSHASLLNALDTRLEAVQIVLAAPEGVDLDDWVRAAVTAPLANRILLRSRNADALPASHPAHGKGPVDGGTAAYVCVGTRCSLPLTSPEALRSLLREGATV